MHVAMKEPNNIVSAVSDSSLQWIQEKCHVYIQLLVIKIGDKQSKVDISHPSAILHSYDIMGI